MNALYWKSEDEMHKELEEDRDSELSMKIKNMVVKDAEGGGA